MATFLDVSGLAAFSKIFVFLLVLLAVYAVFAMNKAFGQAKWISWIISLVVAIFVILSDVASGIIQYVSPWFAVLFFFIIFITMASRIFGTTSPDFGQYKGAFLAIIVIIFIVGALMYVRTQTTLPGDLDEDGNVIKDAEYVTSSNFFLHPKMMGIIFTLLVAIFTVALLAGKSS